MKKATGGWIGLGVYVAGYDLWACLGGHESLSGAFWRAVQSPVGRWLVYLGTGIVVKHLVAPNFLPQIDPLSQAGKRLRKRSDR